MYATTEAPVTEATLPVNFTTRAAYQGKNVLTLLAFTIASGYPTAEFLTFKQALAIGRCVRKGEHGVPVLKVIEAERADGTTFRAPKGYTVFNIAQTDALAERAPKAVA